MKKPARRERSRQPAEKRSANRPVKDDQMNQATADEFEKEGMGIAAKE